MNNFKETADKTLNSIFDIVERDYDYLDVDFEEDRFTAYGDYETALAAYEAEPSVRLLFENVIGYMAVRS